MILPPVPANLIEVSATKEILSTIASIEWKDSGNHGEAPVPSPEDLDNPDYWDTDSIRKYPDVTTRIQNTHERWETQREIYPKLKHPLAPIIRAWQRDQTTQSITPEHDRKFPLAVLKHPMGNFRDLSFVDIETARLREFAAPQRIEQVDLQGYFDFAQQPPSILPDVMPLEVAHPLGLKPTTKKGAVSHVILAKKSTRTGQTFLKFPHYLSIPDYLYQVLNSLL